MRAHIARTLLAAFSALALHAATECARGQAPLPQITVTPPKEKAKKAPAPKQKAKSTKVAPPAVAPPIAQAPAESALQTSTKQFNAARENILPKIGVSTYEMTHQDIEAQPQGSNQSLDKVLLQAPGVSQDSAASGNVHVRNDHANLQFRINGVILPEGVSGFGQFLDTGFVGSLTLVTGALPAQYGLRQTGLVDIQTRSGAFDGGGTISMYGGNRTTLTPSIEYGGTSGRTEYFFTGRGFFSDLGLENATSKMDAIHDQTQQGKAFGYASTLLDDSTRLTSITGVAVQKYQVPDRPGVMPILGMSAFGITDFDSTKLDENQLEKTFYSVLALQKKLTDVDLQLAYFSRYASIHFTPDPIGDLLLNGVASNVLRNSFLNGIQGDAAYRLNPAHTLRSGFYVSGESTEVKTKDLLEPTDAMGNPVDTPFTVVDSNSKLGWLLGFYVQDEWKITNKLTLNVGIRFDQMYQFIDANQFSPRASLVYTPLPGTTLHLGYARYFTPPSQVIATPVTLRLFDNTTQQPMINKESPVLPERSHYYDVGVTQKLFRCLEVGVDGYYKIATDLLDDGQFGQALVLSGFNYAHAFNKGVEFTAKYHEGNLKAYSNLAWGIQRGRDVVSNEFLFDPAKFEFANEHYIHTDHEQTWTGSAGVSYVWNGTRFTTDMIYGTGLRSGLFNSQHNRFYTQVNAGIAHEFQWGDAKPTTVRFDVINVFDHIYEIRDGTGIGVFAPQFGPRRAFFVGLSQKF
jgi:outer membrane receptor protein involved in Fe transport